MSEYIEREFALNVLCRENCGHNYEANKCNNCYTSNFINYLPAADVAEVKHGKWLNFYNDFSVAECSECADMFEVSPDEEPKKEFLEAFKEFYHYCPNCGAKMDLED